MHLASPSGIQVAKASALIRAAIDAETSGTGAADPEGVCPDKLARADRASGWIVPLGEERRVIGGTWPTVRQRLGHADAANDMGAKTWISRRAIFPTKQQLLPISSDGQGTFPLGNEMHYGGFVTKPSWSQPT